MLKQCLAIALGGAAGSVLRYLTATLVHRLWGGQFPYGTLVVNVVGSFAIGYLFVVFVERLLLDDIWRLAIIVGLLGGFTTFSTFSLETLGLIESGDHLGAISNVLISVCACLTAAWAGVTLARAM